MRFDKKKFHLAWVGTVCLLFGIASNSAFGANVLKVDQEASLAVQTGSLAPTLADRRYAQSFIPTVDEIVQVEHMLFTRCDIPIPGGGGTVRIIAGATVEIRSDNGGSPGNTVLGSYIPDFDNADKEPNDTSRQVVFSSPVSVVPGQRYFIVAYRTNDSRCIENHAVIADQTGYPQGKAFSTDSNGDWQEGAATGVSSFDTSEVYRFITYYNEFIVDTAETFNKNTNVLSPYWQSNSGVYTFIAISHPSFSELAPQVGLSVKAFIDTGVQYGETATFTVDAGETRRVFIVSSTHSQINSSNIPDGVFIHGPPSGVSSSNQVAGSGFLTIAPLDGSDSLSPLPNGKYANVTSLTLWGAVVLENTNTGFSMEFIGDLNDSSSHPGQQFGKFASGVN